MGKNTLTVDLHPDDKGHKVLDMTLVCCDQHRDLVWHWAGHPCAACVQDNILIDEAKELRKKNRELRRDMKLLKLELVEERMLHNSTKLDAAEYLAQKKLVDNLVKDRLK